MCQVVKQIQNNNVLPPARTHVLPLAWAGADVLTAAASSSALGDEDDAAAVYKPAQAREQVAAFFAGQLCFEAAAVDGVAVGAPHLLLPLLPPELHLPAVLNVGLPPRLLKDLAAGVCCQCDWVILAIVGPAVYPDLADIICHLTGCCVAIGLAAQLLQHSAYVHGLLDDIEVVGDFELVWIHRGAKVLRLGVFPDFLNNLDHLLPHLSLAGGTLSELPVPLGLWPICDQGRSSALATAAAGQAALLQLLLHLALIRCQYLLMLPRKRLQLLHQGQLLVQLVAAHAGELIWAGADVMAMLSSTEHGCLAGQLHL